MITTQRDLREFFWYQHPNLSRKKIKNYAGDGMMYFTDTRVAWCDFVDMMLKENQISQKLAERATL